MTARCGFPPDVPPLSRDKQTAPVSEQRERSSENYPLGTVASTPSVVDATNLTSKEDPAAPSKISELAEVCWELDFQVGKYVWKAMV